MAWAGQYLSALIALGRFEDADRALAAELVVSVKTVGYHLGNTYAKLGVNSRTQLAALLASRASTP